eukprot:6294444-Alexandrium_andersonii.AAC.1
MSPRPRRRRGRGWNVLGRWRTGRGATRNGAGRAASSGGGSPNTTPSPKMAKATPLRIPTLARRPNDSRSMAHAR